MPRNPNWTRDELILALDLFFRVNPLHTSEDNAEIRALSSLLNSLPIHTCRPNPESFRNANGVYMKLCNFLRLDPSYAGTGLDAGSKLDVEIWDEFAGDRRRLAETAQSILLCAPTLSPAEIRVLTASGDEEFAEGRVLTAVHKRRERSGAATRRKKDAALASSGRLECEVCGFDFREVYGELGADFAECHHTVPLSEVSGIRPTRLQDLAILCSNCHRMIHRSRPMLNVAQLGELMHSEIVDL